MDIDVTMLGGFAVTIEDALVDPAHWRRRHAAAMVKILAQESRRTLHRERVIDMLWPDLTIEDAAPRLHKAAHYARRALGGPGTIVLAAESVTLVPQHDVRVDALQFQALAEQLAPATDRRRCGNTNDSNTHCGRNSASAVDIRARLFAANALSAGRPVAGGQIDTLIRSSDSASTAHEVVQLKSPRLLLPSLAPPSRSPMVHIDARALAENAVSVPLRDPA